MKRLILPMSVLLSAAAVSLARAEWPVTIIADADDTPIKDLRNSTSAPDLGYAGAMLESSTLISEAYCIAPRAFSASSTAPKAATRPSAVSSCRPSM